MDMYKQEWQEIQRNRFRTMKKFLRFLPRRSTLMHSRLLKNFSEGLLKRRFLWSFAYDSMKPALYVGWILTLLPVMGLQIALASLCALVFRANIMVLVALQMISNPFTIGILWPIEYKVGKLFIGFLDKSNQWGLNHIAFSTQGLWSSKSILILKITVAICIGAVCLGSILGFISCCIYKYFARSYVSSYEQFVLAKQKSLQRMKSQSIRLK